MLFLAAAGEAATVTATQNGSWSNGTTWGGSAPLTSDDVVIPAGITVTLSQNESANTLDIQSGGILSTSTFTLTVANNTTVNGNVTGAGTLQLTPAGTLDGTGSITSAVLFSVGGSRTIGSSANLTISGAMTVNSGVTNGGTITSTETGTGLAGTGTWTQGSTGRLNLTGPNTVSSFSANAPGNIVDHRGTGQTIRGTTYYHLYSSSGGTKTLGAALAVDGNLDISAGIIQDGGFQITGGSGTLLMSPATQLVIGALANTNNTSLPAFTSYSLSSSSTIVYQASANQSISDVPYGNLVIQTSSGAAPYTKTASGNITTTGSLAINQLAVGTVTFDVSSFILTVGTDISGNGTLNSPNAIQVNGSNTSFSGGFLPDYDIDFIGSTSSNVRGTTYHRLTVNKTAATAQLAGPITLISDLTVSSGTLYDNGSQITGAPAGTLTVSNAATLKLGSSFPLSFGSTSLGSTSNVIYISAGAQLVDGAPTYGNLYLEGTATHTKTIDGLGITAGTLTLTAATATTLTFDIAGKYNSITGDISRSGSGSVLITFGTGAGVLGIGGNFSNLVGYNAGTLGSVTHYNGTGPQSVHSGAYEYLTINKSSGVASLTGATSTTGLLEIQNGELDLASFQLTTDGVLTVTGILDLASGTLIANNNVGVSGTMSGTSSTVTIGGASAALWSNSGGAGTVSLNTLIVTNTAGVQFSGSGGYSATSLALNGAVVFVDSSVVLTTGIASRTSGHIDGLLAISIANGNNRLFPVGVSGVYLPVDVQAVTGSGTVRVQANNGVHGSATNANILGRFWSIDVATPATVNLTFNYDQAAVTGSETSYVLGRFDGSSWSRPGGSLDRTNNVASITGVLNYTGAWTVGYGSAMGAVEPSVASFSPASATTGTSISIFGSNFTGTTAVGFFNGVNAPAYTPVNDTQITATVPAGATTGPVNVTNASGTGTSAVNFTVSVPSIIDSATSGAWNSGATWVGGNVPSSADHARIMAAHTVTVSAVETVDDLTVFGTLSVNGILTVADQFAWTSGTINGSGTLDLAPASTGLINNTSGALTLDTVTFNSLGNLTWSAVTNNLNVTNGADWNNGGTFTLQNNQTIDWTAGAEPTLVNSGTIVKSVAGTTATDLGFYNNAGSFNLGISGIFELFGTSATRTFIGSGTFQSGIVLLSNGGTIATGANYTAAGTGVLDLAGGTLTIGTGASSVRNLKVAGGTLAGTDGTSNLTVSGTFKWIGGSLAGGPGKITLTGNGDWSGGNKTLGSFTIHNQSSVAWSGGVIGAGNGATITNDGTLDIQFDGVLDHTVGAATFTNNAAGIVRKSGGSSTTLLLDGAGVWNNDGGVFDILTGTMSVGGSFNVLTNGGQITTPSTGDLVLLGATTSNSSGDFVVPSGKRLVFFGGTHNLGSGADFSGAGTYRVAGANVNVNAGTLTTQNFELAGGVLGGTGTTTITGTLTWTAGTIGNIAGGTITYTGTSATINNSIPVGLEYATFNTQGPVTWSASAAGDIDVANGATWNNTALFTIQNDHSIDWTAGGSPTFNNSGTLTKFSAMGTTLIAGNFNNSGGTIDVPTGQFNFTGPFTQSVTSHLKFGIGGASVGTGYGRINTTQPLNLNSAISTAYLVGAYTPPTGQQFIVLITSGALTGTFGTTNYTSFGRTFTPTYNANNVTLTIDGPTVTSVTPATGSIGGGNAVTVNGTGFVAGGSLAVNFGGSACNSPNVTSPTTITCTTTSHVAGTVNVNVTNGDGVATTGTNVFTYNNAPSIVSLSRSTGSTEGGTYVLISGTNLTTVTSVTFGASTATILSTSPFVVHTPAHVPGIVSVTITNPDGSATLSNSYTFVPPVCDTPDGVVSWWRAGGTAADSAGANTASLAGGAAYTTGKVGQAFDFPGTGSYVTIPDSASLHQDAFSVEAWVRFVTTTGTQTIVSKPLGSGTANSFNIRYSGGDLEAESGGELLEYTWTPTIGQWYHVVLVSDGDMVLYLDGQPVAETSVGAVAADAGGGGSTPTYDSNPMLIGAESDNTILGDYLSGQIDEVTFYNIALANGSVEDLYDAGTLGKCSPTKPVVLTVTPNVGPTAGGTNVTIFGSSLSGATNVQFATNSGTVNSSTQTTVNATTPAGSIGGVTVFVTTPAGTDYQTGAFTYSNVSNITSFQNGPWSSTSTWTGGVVPNATDNVTIAHDVTVDVNVTTNDLIVSAGSLILSNLVTVDGTFAFSAGTIAGASSITLNGGGAHSWTGGTLAAQLVVPLSKALAINGALVTLGNNGLLTNNGTVNLNGGTIRMTTAASAVINNNGSFNVNGDFSLTNFNCCAAGNAFNNAGTFTKVSGGGVTEVQSYTTFNNTGTVSVNTGTLRVTGGGNSSAGLVSILASAKLELGGGAHTFSGSSSFSSFGTVAVVAGVANFNTSGFNTEVFQLSAGTASFGTSSQTNQFSMTGGTLSGSGGLQLAGAGPNTLSGGTLSGLLTVLGTRTLGITGTFTLGTSGNLVNNGTVNQTASISVLSGAGASIANNSTYNVQGDYSFTDSGCCAANNSFTNSGAFNKTAGASFTDFGSLTAFHNTANVNVNAGTLRLLGGGVSPTGTITVAAGSTYEIAGGTYTIGSNFSSAGLMRFSGGTATISSGISVADLLVNGGTVNFSGGVTAAKFNATLGIFGGVTLDGAGPFSWSSGNLNGSLTVATGRTLSVTNTCNILGGTLTNNGTISMSASILVGSGANATVNNNGVIDISGDFGFPNGTCCLPGSTFNNNSTGTLRKLSGTGASTIGGNYGTFTNNGFLDIQSGYVEVQGNFTQGGGSALTRVRLAGTAPATQYSYLTVGGNVVLAGTLDVTYNAFTPAAGDTFIPLAFNSNSGGTDFTTKTGLSYAGGTLTYAINATNATLTAPMSTVDVTVSKSGSVSATTGQTLVYTLFVQNQSATDTATSATLSDVLGAIGLTYVSHSAPAPWNCTGGTTFNCTATSLLPSSSSTILLTVTAPATPGAVTNVANVAAANEPGANNGNNSGSFITNVSASSVNLALTMTAAPVTVTSGSSTTITIGVSNNGSASATNVTVTNPIPPQFTHVSSSATQGSGCSVAGSNVVCNLGTMAAGGTATVTIQLLSATAGGTVTNSATVTSTEADANGVDNTAAQNVVITGGSNLVVHTILPGGSGSLSQAIADLNSIAPVICTTPCQVRFAMPGPPAIHIISVPVTHQALRQASFDGDTQPGYSGSPVIFLDGMSNAQTGLKLSAANSSINNLGFMNFADAAIVVDSANAVIDGNYVGMDFGGTAAPNLRGIDVVNGSAIIGGTGNFIAGNTSDGVRIGTAGSTLLGNLIGIKPDGITPLPNGGDGVQVAATASGTTIGGLNAADANGIANNGGNGVSFGVGNAASTVLGNGIFSNGNLGIDRNANNTADQGPPTPVISSAVVNAGNVTAFFSSNATGVAGTGSLRIEFFRADAAGQGQQLASSICVAGNNLNTSTSFAAGSITNGTPIVATATPYTSAACTGVNGSGTTEFSAPAIVGNCTPPPASITGPSSVCAGSTTTYSTTFIAGATYVWSAPGAASTGANGSSSFTVTAGTSGPINLSVTVTDASTCSATAASAITVNPMPVATVTAPPNVCGNSSGNTASVNATAGATYNWTLTNGTITAGQGTTAITFTAGSTGSVGFSVAVTAATCVTTGTATTTINPLPNVSMTATPALCPNASGTATVNPTAGATYLWTVTGATLNAGQGTNSITYTAGASGNVVASVSVTSNGCSANNSQTIPISASPAAVITAPANVCPNTTGNAASVAPFAGATYAWTITGGAITAGQGTEAITFSAGATGNVVLGVTATSGSCSAIGSHTATINATPIVTVTAPATTCALSASNNASVAAQPGASYSWALSGGTITSGQSTNAITFSAGNGSAVVINVSVTVNGCSGNATHTVNLTAAPSATISAPNSLEAATTGHIASVANTAGATYSWSITGGSITGGQATRQVTFTTGTGASLRLTATVTAGGCSVTDNHVIQLTSSTPADVAITKTAPPAVGLNASLSYVLTVTNNGPSAAPGVVVSDLLPGGLTLVSATSSTFNCSTASSTVICTASSLAASASGTITIVTTTPSVGGSVTNTASVTANAVDPNPSNNSASATTNIGSTQTTCPSTPPSLNAPAQGASELASPVTFSWSSVADATSYEVWLGAEGNTPALAASTAATSINLSVPSGGIEWYVVARFATCDPLTSAKRTFNVRAADNCATHTAPQLMSPSGNASLPSPVSFAWTAVPQAIGYKLFIRVNGEAPQDLATTDGATFFTGNVPPGQIAFFVEALFNGCPPTRSDASAFTSLNPDNCASHQKAVNSSPAVNATLQNAQVDFNWNAVAGAASYRVWLMRNGGAAEVLGTTSETTLREFIPPGTHRWFVEALFEGCPATESEPTTFTIRVAEECSTAAASLIAPANGATVTSPNVTFNWTSVPNAAGYELWLSLSGGTPALQGTTTATSLTREVAPGRLLWFVRALFNGCPARESARGAFTYEPPADCAATRRPTLIAPNGGAQLASPVSFRWSAVPNATRYELYVAQGNGAPALQRSTIGTRADDLAPQNGAKSWFVRAFFNGCPSLDSTPSRFVVVPQAAACTPLTRPRISAPGSISGGVKYTVSWSPIAGATGYVLHRATQAGFAGAETIQTNDTTADFTDSNTSGEIASRYYRVRALDNRCSTPQQGPFSATFAVFILPRSNNEASTPVEAAQLVTYSIPLGPELAGQSFEASTTEPWLTVSPSSGIVPAGGTSLIVTADTTGLPVGTNLGGITLSLTTPSTSNRQTSLGTTVKNSTVSVSLVTPVTPAPKDTPPPDALIIPAVAHADGFNTRFQSDVRVTNSSPQVMKYQLTFTPSGEDGLAEGKQTTIDIEPGATVALDDVLKSWFATGTSNSSTGSLEIRPLTETASSTSGEFVTGLPNLVTFAASRTFNLTPNGTFGQFIPAIPYSNFIGNASLGANNLQASALTLQQIAQSSQYRTNLGFVEGSGEAASLAVSVFNNLGQKVSEFPVELKGGQHLQMNSFLAGQNVELKDGRVEVRVTSDTGRVTAYASVLDNNTADPLLVTPVPLAQAGSAKYVVPGVADLSSGNANWRTDMRLFNAGDDAVTAQLTFYSQSGGEPQTAQVLLQPHEVKELDATLSTVFGISNNGGAVHIETASPVKLVATARTYNQTTSGTFGQFISAVTPNEAASLGSRPLQILQVEESDRYRSNIGIAEVNGRAAKIEITVVPPDSRTAAIIEADLAPNEFRQLPSLLEKIGMDNTFNARVTVRVIGGDGRVAAYASVIDAITQDPTYVPAQ
jgi:hypothetical protein